MKDLTHSVWDSDRKDDDASMIDGEDQDVCMSDGTEDTEITRLTDHASSTPLQWI